MFLKPPGTWCHRSISSHVGIMKKESMAPMLKGRQSTVVPLSSNAEARVERSPRLRGANSDN